MAAGLANVGKSASEAAVSPLRRAADAVKQSFAAGREGASASETAAAASAPDSPPAWAKAMKQRQTVTHGASVATHTLKGGDSHGGGAGPDISEKD